MTRRKPPRGGSKPRIGSVAATARIELVVPPEVKVRWQAAALETGTDVSAMIRAAVEKYIRGGK